MASGSEFGDLAMVAARSVAARAGLAGAGDPVLVRLGTRAVFRLDGGRVLARVARDGGRADAARREVEVARWLRGQGLPADEPLGGDQPYRVCGTVVTLWRAVDGDWTTPADLAGVLKRLHALPLPVVPELPVVDLFAQSAQRIDAADALSGDERSTLRGRLEALRPQAAAVRPVLPHSVIHGDASVGNLLKTVSGELVLFDLEGVGLGMPEWDLTITAVYRGLGWHSREEYAGFCDVYGFDVTGLDGYPVLKAVQELRMTCWLAAKAGDDPKIAAEVRQRMADLADPSRPRSWKPY